MILKSQIQFQVQYIFRLNLELMEQIFRVSLNSLAFKFTGKISQAKHFSSYDLYAKIKFVN